MPFWNTFLWLKQLFDAKDYHLSVFQKLRHSDTCNQVKSCTKHSRLRSVSTKTDLSFNFDQQLMLKQSCFGIFLFEEIGRWFDPGRYCNLFQWFILTAHNWQKWKSTFLTCPCHKIYRVEAVGLKSSNYTSKFTIFVKMWNLGY